MTEKDEKKPAENTGASRKPPSTQPPALMAEMQKLKIFYAAFTGASILMFTPIPPVPMVATLAMLVIVLACYLSAKFGNETPFSAHYRWLIRTFWIGLWLFLPLATILAMGLILKYGDKSAFDAVEQASDATMIPDDMGFKQFMDDNGTFGLITMLIAWGGFGAWWFTRLWRGFKGLQSGPSFQFKNVKSWWV